LSVLPTLKDPRGAVVPVTVSKLAQQDWSIDIELTTPPLSAGTYELRMFVEPTIAFVDLQVLVARDGAASVVKTTFPSAVSRARPHTRRHDVLPERAGLLGVLRCGSADVSAGNERGRDA
jgi:hypothetical protein